MSSGFRLPNGDVADYQWGSLIPTFTPRAQVSTKTLVNVLAATMNGTGSWSTNAEFREAIAFEHEIVHYFQDILSGVGHWDYLKRRDYHRKALTLARSLSYTSATALPYKTVEAETIKREMLDDSIVLPAAAISDKRRDEILSRIKALPHQILSGEESIGEPFQIENILEAEAVATVALQMYGLSMNEMQSEIAVQHQSLYAPFYMNRQYGSTLWFMFGSFDEVFAGAGWEGKEARAYRMMQYKLVCFFVDLACAHPSPSLLESGSLSQSDYEPGVKLARLFSAFLYLNEQDTQQFLIAMFKDHDYVAAENLLLQKCDCAYPTSEAIYANWAAVFSDMLQEDDNRILKLRYRSCQSRLALPNVRIKLLNVLLEHKLPLFFFAPTGINSHAFSAEELDPDESKIFFADLMSNSRDLAWMDFFFENGRFVCPFAEGQVCQAAVPACKSGITSLVQYPRSSDCLVRRSLRKNSWFLSDEM